jgi:hypothetical protein
MSGGIPFNRQKLDALTGYALSRAPRPFSGEDVAWLIFNSDMDAYRKLGKPITGATYLRGRRHPEVREVGDGYFERATRDAAPLWSRIVAGLLTAYCFGRALRGR